MTSTRLKMAGQKASKVGAKTLPSSVTRDKKKRHKKDNPEAGLFWHQGFATIKVGKTDVVPFLEQATAERIAEQAAAAMERPMFVFPVQDFWGYAESRLEEAA